MLLASGFTIFLQYLVDGLIKGTGYGILGLSFGLIVAVTTRFHFAWAICYAAAGFLAAWLQVHEGLSAWSACVVGLCVAAIVSVLVEFLIYRPLAVRSGSHAVLAVFVVGFGLTIFGENLIHLVLPTSSGIASESLTWIPFDFYSVGGVDFTAQDIAWVSILWFAAVVTWGLLRYTPLGRQINAVRVNPEMAEAVGIRKERTYLIVFALGALLAGLHSELFAMKFAATPEMGEQPLFYAFVVAFLAGLGKPPLWVMLVGTLLGVVESVSAEVVSVSWGQAVVFGILLVALIFKAARVWRPRLFTVPNLALKFPPVRSE